MYDGLTPRQRQIMQFINERIRRKGYPPSVREIGDAVGLSSSSTVHGHLNRLEEKGLIRRDPTKPRAIEVLEEGGARPGRPQTANVPLVGRVTAGQPVLAIENIEEYYQLPLAFVQDEGSFLLQVRGDSMIEAGIYDRDYVLVRPQSAADNGEIVVALIGDEATVKRFYREGDHVRLQPANSRLQPIIAREVTVLGKVTALLRRFT